MTGENYLSQQPPKCLWCHSAKHVSPGSTEKTWWCSNCGIEFDPVDDGDVSYGPPDRRMRREERRRERKEARR